jgi:L-fuconolactonase
MDARAVRLYNPRFRLSRGAVMLIVDSQVHIWSAHTPDRPWPAADPNLPAAHKRQPITVHELVREMDAAGVDRAVLISPVFEGARNDVVVAAAHAHPDRFVVMGRFDPDAADARATVEAWRDEPAIRGVRFTFHRPHQRPLLTEGRLDWLWAHAERAGLPAMLLVPHHDLHYIAHLAERHPALKISLDHFGLTEGRDDAAFAEFDKLLALARYPNIAVKASCLPLYTTDRYPFRRLHPHVRRAYDAFGPRRMFWGSDLSRLPCSYREGVTMFTEEMPWLPARDLEFIMGRALCEWLGWTC